MSFNLPIPSMGRNTEETIDNLIDTMLIYRKELNFLMKNLSLDNMPMVGIVFNEVEDELYQTKTLITQTANQIMLEVSDKVGIDEVISRINLSSEGIAIVGQKIALEGTITANGNFMVHTDGSIYANNANITGTIHTQSIDNYYITLYGSKIDGGRQMYGNSYTIGTAEYSNASRSGVIQLFGYNSSISSTITRKMDVGNNSILVGGSNLVMGGSGESRPTIITRNVLISDLTREVRSSVALNVRGGLEVDTTLYTDYISSIDDDLHIGAYDFIYMDTHTRPNSDELYNLGSPNRKWRYIYCMTGGLVEGSDARKKQNIDDIPADLLEYISQEVSPKAYVVQGKYHFGYIAQDVERALFKYAVNKVGYNDAREYVDKFNILHRDESYLSLVYNQLFILKEQAIYNKIKDLELRLKLLEGEDNGS